MTTEVHDPPPPNDEGDEEAGKVKGYARHVQVTLSFFGLVIYGAQFASLSLAMTGMNEQRSSNLYEAVKYSIAEKGTLSGMFTYGNMLTTIPAGYVACVYKPLLISSWTCGLFSGIAAIIFPFVAAHYGFGAACACRAIQGALQGFVVPCAYAHVSNWVVAKENEKFSWVWSGMSMGGIIISATGGIIAFRLGSWPLIFYFTGVAGIVWSLACYMLGVETPDTHLGISLEEKQFIQSNITINKLGKIKWWKIFTSIPVWAILLTNACDMWVLVTMVNLFPTYLSIVLGLTIEQIGYLNGSAFLSNLIGGFFYAYLGHQTASCMRPSIARRVWTSIGLYCGLMIPCIIFQFSGNDVLTVSIVWLFGSFAHSAKHAGISTNYYDLAPSLVGILSAASMFFGSLVAFTGPIIGGFIINEGNPDDWRTLFKVCAVVQFVGGTIFQIFSSTKLQPWNGHNDNDTGART